jgi:predicted SAM-dependent methyltransferase
MSMKHLTSALPAGIAHATNRFVKELRIRKRHYRGLRLARQYRGCRALTINIGSSNVIKQGWVNIDMEPTADLTLDLREPLPFDDQSCKTIYSEHFLEHLDYPYAVTNLLVECLRILEPGGLLSCVVPDGGFALDYYTRRHSRDPEIAELHLQVAHANIQFDPRWCVTQMDHVNYLMRQNGEHRWIYDEETLGNLLRRVGFTDIRRRLFDPQLDQNSRRFGSLYMQCRKPSVADNEFK